jgi:hypothetical protein
MIVAWMVLAAAAATSTAPVTVSGNTDCPTPAEVEAALVGLVDPATAPLAPDVLDLIRQGGSVKVRLSNAAREVIGEKPLPRSLSCGERARTAAIMVAAWEARLRGAASPLSSPPPPAKTPPPVIVSPAVPAFAPTLTQAGAPPGAAGTGTVAGPIQWQISAVALVSIAGGDAAPAATVEFSFARRDSPFAVGVGVLGVGTHSTAVASGRGAWRRLGGMVDLKSSSRWPAVELQMHAGLALGALVVTGEALPKTSGTAIFDPGVLAGLRLGFPGRRLTPWLEATAASWPRSHTLIVDGSPVSVQLPPFEALLGAGVSFGQER